MLRQCPALLSHFSVTRCYCVNCLLLTNDDDDDDDEYGKILSNG